MVNPSGEIEYVTTLLALTPRAETTRMHSHLLLRGLTRAICVVALTAAPVAAQLQLPTSFRIGPYGEMTSRPWFDPAAGARSVMSIASVVEIRLDLGARRPEFTDSSGSLVGMVTPSLQYNLAGGYPYRQIGLFAGYQRVFGGEHGHEWLAGISTATSHARGEHVQYELSFGPRYIRGRPTKGVLRFKIIVLRLPPLRRGVPSPPPLDLQSDSTDAGGVRTNPSWKGARGQDVDRMCRFSYVQTSETPVLLYRPECIDSSVPTLNQPISPRTAKHWGLSCSVKDAEPIIRGHINWAVVNQAGRLRWQGYSSGTTGDHDFDLFMEAPALVTNGNIRANRKQKELQDHPKRDGLIELEFNAEETARLFSPEHGGELWSPLIDLPRLPDDSPVYVAQNARADFLFRDRRAVVTGLLGLDGEHDFHTELHPVLALAVDVSHQVPGRFGHAWLVLVRNMGNEGECSSGQLPWVTRDTTRYTLEIPWQTGADSVVVDAAGSRFGFIARRNVTLQVEIDRPRAVRLVANLPRPTLTDSAGIVYGTLRLRWFDHGRPVPSDLGVAPPSATPRPRQPDRGKHPFVPVKVETFPRTRRLCFTLAPAEPVRRDPLRVFVPQTVLRDSAPPAPAVPDNESCR
jgi:hypothetical protein